MGVQVVATGGDLFYRNFVVTFSGALDDVFNSAKKSPHGVNSQGCSRLTQVVHGHHIFVFNCRVLVQTGIWPVLSLIRFFTSFRGIGARATTSPRPISSHAGIFISKLRELIGFPSTNALYAAAQLAKQCFDCGSLLSKTAKSCGMPSYSFHSTDTPHSAAWLAITRFPSRPRSSLPQANHNGGAPLQSPIATGETSSWSRVEAAQ